LKEYSFDEIKKKRNTEKIKSVLDQNNVQQIVISNGNFLLLERNFIEGRDKKRF
jgi:hypothetical protein